MPIVDRPEVRGYEGTNTLADKHEDLVGLTVLHAASLICRIGSVLSSMLDHMAGPHGVGWCVVSGGDHQGLPGRCSDLIPNMLRS